MKPNFIMIIHYSEAQPWDDFVTSTNTSTTAENEIK